MKGLKIISGTACPSFAQKVAEHAGIPLSERNISRFADGEVQIEIKESIRGADVFVIQSTCPPVNENLMELFLINDALKRASAKSITNVIPYYGYARQDRKATPRSPISARCVADLLTSSGADRVVSVDLHSNQIQGFFGCPFDHLFAIPTLASAWIEEKGQGDSFITVSPDAGGVERSRAFAKKLDCGLAIIDKRRIAPNKAQALNLIGDVEGKIALIVDDMIDTAGTLTQAVDTLLDHGAKEVFALATHPVFSGPAIERMIESPIKEIWVGDTLPLSQAAQESGKVKVVSMAPIVAEAISRIFGNSSLSSLFYQ